MPSHADKCRSSCLSASANNMLKQMIDLVRTIPAERELWLNKIRTLEPSAEEKHRLEWMTSKLEVELKELSRLTEATQRDSAVLQQSMEDVDGTFSLIKREQEEDKIKIQRLLALCQPITSDLTLQFGEVNTQDGLRVALAPATGKDADPVRTAIAELPGTFVVPLRTKGYASYLERRAKVIEDAVHDIRTVGEECIHIPEGMSASRMDQMAEVEHYTSKLLQVLQEVSVSVDDKLVVAMDEYLRLRHNARMAHIASTEFRQKYSLARAEREHQAREHAQWVHAKQNASYKAAEQQLNAKLKSAQTNKLEVTRRLQTARLHYSDVRDQQLLELKRLQRRIATERKLYKKLERARKEQLTPLVQSMNELSTSIKAEEMQIRHEVICKSGYRVTY
eukprot:543945_1